MRNLVISDVGKKRQEARSKSYLAYVKKTNLKASDIGTPTQGLAMPHRPSSDSYWQLFPPYHGWHCPTDMAVRMRELQVKPWVGVHVSLAFKFVFLHLRQPSNYPLCESRWCGISSLTSWMINRVHAISRSFAQPRCILSWSYVMVNSFVGIKKAPPEIMISDPK